MEGGAVGRSGVEWGRVASGIMTRVSAVVFLRPFWRPTTTVAPGGANPAGGGCVRPGEWGAAGDVLDNRQAAFHACPSAAGRRYFVCWAPVFVIPVILPDGQDYSAGNRVSGAWTVGRPAVLWWATAGWSRRHQNNSPGWQTTPPTALFRQSSTATFLPVPPFMPIH